MKKRKEKNSFRILMLVFAVALILAVSRDMIGKNSGHREATMENGKLLIFVNSENKVPKDYEPKLMTLTNGQQIDEDIYPSLQKMFDDMRAEGYYPEVRSGYRSEENQEDIFENKYASFREQGYSKKRG